MLELPDEVRPLLKRPLGQLFSSVTTAIERLRQLRPTRLIAVGDIVTAEFIEAGLKLDVAVVDFLVMRSPVDKKIRRTIDSFDVKIVRVKNPAGTITQELRTALDEAKPPLKIIVDGEEDLATLPAVLSAPLGSVVVYGQPDEGIVIVEVTESKRREFKMLLEQFKTSG